MPSYFSTDNPGATLVGAIRSVITRPAAFFNNMPASETCGNSAIFLAITLFVPFLLLMLPFGIMALITLPAMLLLMLLITWLWAWYLGWAARTFCNTELSTANAFQICAYSNVPSLLAWIPVFNILASFWTLFLEWRGLTAFAKISSGTALAILLIPLVVLMISGAILAVLLGMAAAQYGMSF